MRKLIIFLFLALLAGCDAASEHISPSPGLIITTNPTVVSEIAAPSPSATPTPEPDYSRLTTNCVEVVDHVPEDVDLPGVMVLNDRLLNFETGEEVNLRWKNDIVSPDGKTLAEYSNQDGLVLLNSAGEVVYHDTAILDDHWRPVYWADSQNLVLTTISDEFGPNPSLALNVISGDQQEISQDLFPDFEPWRESIGILWGSYGFKSRISISPDLKYVVYATYDIEDYTHYLVLWDMEKNKEIARIAANQESSFPRWSSDGRYFLTDLKQWGTDEESGSEILLGTEIARINTSGETERLTYLTTVYYAAAKGYVWSPDGTKVAFSLYLFEEQRDVSSWWNDIPQLAVLDIETGEVTNYCLPVYGTVWSPDGEFLALGGKPPDELEALDTDRVYVVNLEENIAYTIDDENNSPQGWMVYNPEDERSVIVIPTPTPIPVSVAENQFFALISGNEIDLSFTEEQAYEIFNEISDQVHQILGRSGNYNSSSNDVLRDDNDPEIGIWRELSDRSTWWGTFCGEPDIYFLLFEVNYFENANNADLEMVRDLDKYFGNPAAYSEIVDIGEAGLLRRMANSLATCYDEETEITRVQVNINIANMNITISIIFNGNMNSEDQMAAVREILEISKEELKTN